MNYDEIKSEGLKKVNIRSETAKFINNGGGGAERITEGGAHLPPHGH